MALKVKIGDFITVGWTKHFLFYLCFLSQTQTLSGAIFILLYDFHQLTRFRRLFASLHLDWRPHIASIYLIKAYTKAIYVFEIYCSSWVFSGHISYLIAKHKPLKVFCSILGISTVLVQKIIQEKSPIFTKIFELYQVIMYNFLHKIYNFYTTLFSESKLLTTWLTQFCVITYANLFIFDFPGIIRVNSILWLNLNYKNLLKFVHTTNILCINLNYNKSKQMSQYLHHVYVPPKLQKLLNVSILLLFHATKNVSSKDICG